jgi:hypothetical protein
MKLLLQCAAMNFSVFSKNALEDAIGAIDFSKSFQLNTYQQRERITLQAKSKLRQMHLWLALSMPLVTWVVFKKSSASSILISKIQSNFSSLLCDFRDKLVKGCPFILTMKILRAFQSIFEVTDQNFS